MKCPKCQRFSLIHSVRENALHDIKQVLLECGKCHAFCAGSTKKVAIAAWNRRANE